MREIERLAKEHPEAFEKVATAKDDELQEKMLEILDGVEHD